MSLSLHPCRCQMRGVRGMVREASSSSPGTWRQLSEVSVAGPPQVSGGGVRVMVCKASSSSPETQTWARQRVFVN